ncbi:hypothetical protein [Labrys sp. ZIDIC5]|uniref:hypothetical protein n=1 Tax=Labrys sedimenti TaxID=3106036 RepID=UPI002ACAC6B6|nr:hypothetical protein [Labrys sp. ZIDIC5]MDZ5450034.1 hypothetical protein [Labrys sp. ZIDIC5]
MVVADLELTVSNGLYEVQVLRTTHTTQDNIPLDEQGMVVNRNHGAELTASDFAFHRSTARTKLNRLASL